MPVRSHSVTPEEEAQRKAAFGAALTRAMGSRSVEWLASSMETSSGTVRNWRKGTHAPTPFDVFRIEQLLGLAGGRLSQHLGYVPVDEGSEPLACTLEEALRSDPSISIRERAVIESVLAITRGNLPE